MTSDRRVLGKYYTINNPFTLKAFKDWLDVIQNLKSQIILEPFAGANNIPKMITNSKIMDNEWKCFDIEPQKNLFPIFHICERNTIEDFPKGFNVCITNPPYLGKSSASRRKLKYPDTDYDDLYKYCLEIMLNNVSYVAAIIPETFITSGLFHDRLYAVISLTCKMFEDTECPVCLALFVPKEECSFKIYRMNEYLGTYEELFSKRKKAVCAHPWKFNDKDGNLGIICVDNSKEKSIKFCKGSEIEKSLIKVSSRSKTRVSGIPENIDLNIFINTCNKILNDYRGSTKDVFLTSFKGLRKDGYYRRRLDFKEAKNIMNLALEELQGDVIATHGEEK